MNMSMFQKLFPRLNKLGQRTYEGYINALHNRPILTKAITTGTLYFVSDTMSQYIENREKEQWNFDYKRAFRFFTFGLLATGPIFHYWYHLLDTRFPKKVMTHVIIKSGLDQIVCAPIFDAFFFIGMGVLEGKDSVQIKEKLKNDWLKTYLVDCAIWPLCNIISFRYISNRQRVLFMNLINLGWGSVLSTFNNNNSHQTTPTTPTTSQPQLTSN